MLWKFLFWRFFCAWRFLWFWLLLAKFSKLILQLLILPLLAFPILSNLVQNVLGLDGELSILNLSLGLLFRKFIDFLVESKYLLGKFPLYSIMALYVGLYVVLVGLNSLNKSRYLLVTNLLKFGYRVNLVPKTNNLSIDIQKPLSYLLPIGSKKDKRGVYPVKKILIVLLVNGIDYLLPWLRGLLLRNRLRC